MSESTFKTMVEGWRQRARSLNQILKPITDAPIDINDPNVDELLDNMPHPADESGLRVQLTTLFNEIVAEFPSLDADSRQETIDMLYEYDSVMYAAVIDADLNSEDGYRKHLILFVIEDGGRDTRDAIMQLENLREFGRKSGYDVTGIFSAMADLASKRDKFGMGSTRELLLTRR